jgi:hypothetical protein
MACHQDQGWRISIIGAIFDEILKEMPPIVWDFLVRRRHWLIRKK